MAFQNLAKVFGFLCSLRGAKGDRAKAAMRKVEILPHTDFWGSKIPQSSVIPDHLKNIRFEDGKTYQTVTI